MIERPPSARSGFSVVVSLCVIAAVCIGCAGIKKPWRDYSPRPFSSAEWLAGDKIERGRMLQGMFRNPALEIASRELATKSLGEPDFKKTVENREVWFYRIDLGISGAMDAIPVSFDDKGRGSMGMAKGGTMSIAVKEDEL